MRDHASHSHLPFSPLPLSSLPSRHLSPLTFPLAPLRSRPLKFSSLPLDVSPLKSIYRVFQKSSPLKLLGIFALRLNLFCVKFCKFVCSLYPHIFTNFCRFIIIFHLIALIFHEYPSFLLCQVLRDYAPRKMKMQLFGNEVIFPHRVSQCLIIL